MGNFRIVIDAVGDHGQDRAKKTGELVDFTNGRTDGNTPEAIIHRAITELMALGTNVLSAKVYHWPGDTVYQCEPPAHLNGEGKECITDDLITGVRKGNF